MRKKVKKSLSQKSGAGQMTTKTGKETAKGVRAFILSKGSSNSDFALWRGAEAKVIKSIDQHGAVKKRRVCSPQIDDSW